MKCQKCGTEHNSNFCPNCGSKTKKPISKGRKIAAIIIGVFGLLMVFSAAINWEDTSTYSSNSTSSTNSTNSNAVESKNEQKQIYSDENIKVNFVKIYDANDYGVNMAACYIQLKVENIGQQTVNVSLVDAYANDSAITVMSGLPMTLAPSKNSQAPFLFGYNNIVENIGEIKKLEFKIVLYDENYSNFIEKTETITINF